ncbi:hypothetical protein F2Q70_00036352 [Brassica cretica]|uniref:Uncharacterized protein n=1 Tax=Brassica cretica TaxID=69181 RepID=A0A8S9JZ27_BRACR|nr:hypothetical protein F2Q70_00036352 [Brassica cretica]
MESEGRGILSGSRPAQYLEDGEMAEALERDYGFHPARNSDQPLAAARELDKKKTRPSQPHPATPTASVCLDSRPDRKKTARVRGSSVHLGGPVSTICKTKPARNSDQPLAAARELDKKKTRPSQPHPATPTASVCLDSRPDRKKTARVRGSSVHLGGPVSTICKTKIMGPTDYPLRRVTRYCITSGTYDSMPHPHLLTDEFTAKPSF